MISSIIYLKDSKNVVYHTSATEEVTTKFKPGFYNSFYDNQGNTILNKVDLKELHKPFENKTNNEVIKAVTHFFKSKKLKSQINSMGFPMKLGVLLTGKQGTGKTTLMNYLSYLLIETKSAIVFICDDKSSLMATIDLVKQVREIQDEPIVVILDELETYIITTESENKLKSFLDGNESIDNVLILGATNYPEKIPEPLTRPSRFGYIRSIEGIDNQEELEAVVVNMLKSGGIDESHLPKIMKRIKIGDTLDEVKVSVINYLTGNKIGVNDLGKKQNIGFGTNVQDKLEMYDELDEEDEIYYHIVMPNNFEHHK